MTNDLEKQFFDTFGIEPEIFTGCKLEKNNWKEDTCPFEKDGIMDLCHKVCKYAFTEREIYPQITDTHYLKLICILHTTNIVQLCTTNVENLKEEVLLTLCYWVDKRDIKHQVRTLFEEG